MVDITYCLFFAQISFSYCASMCVVGCVLDRMCCVHLQYFFSLKRKPMCRPCFLLGCGNVLSFLFNHFTVISLGIVSNVSGKSKSLKMCSQSLTPLAIYLSTNKVCQNLALSPNGFMKGGKICIPMHITCPNGEQPVHDSISTNSSVEARDF